MERSKFKVFISWSKSPAREIAEALKELMEKIFPDPNISFFVSSADKGGTHAGDRFRSILDSNLETSNYGILILTKNNYSQPWIMFESGALSKDSQISKIVPVFFNRDKNNLEEPLKPFNNIQFKKDDFEQLAYSIKMAQFETKELNSDQTNTINDSIEKHWAKFENKVNNAIENHQTNIEEITENVTSLMMDESAYEKILSKRETHLEELISNLSTDKAKRIVIFGGISTKLREESTINSLAIWLINNPESKLFICHENSDVAKQRADDLSDRAYNKELNKNVEIQKRKVEELNRMKDNLLNTIGEKYRHNIFFIEIVRTLSVYVTIHDEVVYFTPVLDKRSSDTFTFKLKKSRLINDIIEYIESRIDESMPENKIILQELANIKKENNGK